MLRGRGDGVGEDVREDGKGWRKGVAGLLTWRVV